MKRPTIKDLAQEAGVSISTVNRVLGGSGSVRNIIVQQVKEAAERIGYYGLGTIRSQIISRKPKFRFGFLLLQPNRSLYKMLATAFQVASQAIETHEIETQIVFAEDLSPQFVSSKLLELGQNCNAIGVVSAVHPLVTESISKLDEMNVPVFGLISQLSTTGAVNYVGLDNWKVGRQAAWYFHHFCQIPSKIGILVGNHRYRCQEMNEAGFRSYFREFATDFQLLEPISTFETSSIAEEMTEKLLEEHPDLAGLYVAGGGITGAMNAIRTCGRSGKLFLIGHDLTEPMRAGLLDGTLTIAIAHPLQRMAEATVSGMISAIKAGTSAGNQTIVLPFDTYTRENL